jgi:hypothetical protein
VPVLNDIGKPVLGHFLAERKFLIVEEPKVTPCNVRAKMVVEWRRLDQGFVHDQEQVVALVMSSCHTFGK